jgi:tripartite-type tricarboxylate transporter receptor subunit TctC
MQQPSSARRRFLERAGAGVLASAFATSSRAAAYPVRPITLIVPFAPGGPTDASARLFAKAVGSAIGQTIVVDNRPGAGGTLGGGVAARAAADGYTLLWGGTSTIAVAPGLYPTLPYDPVTSFQPISRAVTGPLVLGVSKKLDCTSVAQLVDMARQRPGQLNYGSSGVGSILHLTGEMLKANAGVDIVHVPYKGASYVMTDLAAGTLQMAFLGLGHAMAHTSEIRILATSGRHRSPQLPAIPTMIESGQRDFESMEWFGLLAPAGLPPAVLEKLSAAYSQASQTASVRDGVASLELEAVNESPEQFRLAIASEGAKWKTIIQNAHIVI